MDYDVVVVGAGSAGTPLAARLSEDPERRVLLLEAGPDYPEFASLPDELKYNYSTAMLYVVSGTHDWQFTGRASPLAPEMRVARGKVVGGGSSINGTIFLRGTPEGYDEWAAAGNDGWSYAALLPLMRKLEDDDYGDSDIHGRGGPMRLRRYPESEWIPCHRAFYEAAREAGFPHCDDHNAPWSEGVGSYPFNNPDDVRWSTALGYLPAARGRPNFELWGGACAVRLVFEGRRVVGVEVERGGERSTVKAPEVVLSAGAINSPHLLLLSGIGPADSLRELGLDVVKDAPGVGKNLQDHPMIQVPWRLRDGFQTAATDARVQTSLRYTATGSSVRNDMWIANVGSGDVMVMYPGIHQPASRGELRLVSADPQVQPALDYDYMSDEWDRVRMREAVRLCDRFGRSAPLARILDGRVDPSDEVLASDDALDEWMLRTTITSNHITSTCKMGPASDRAAVVDHTGRVHGVDGLRVVDASIMPTISRGATNLTSVLIGERIADMMRSSA